MSAARSDSLALGRDEIEARVRELGPWFHNFDFGGVRTAPEHFLGDYPACKWKRFAHALPDDLRGMTVLDVGCNAGFYAIEMKKRGAERVVGIDTDQRYLDQARLAARVAGVDIDWVRLDVYAVGELGERFDVVLFMGVLYHLRYPLLALDLLREYAVGRLLVFQSMLRGSHDVADVAADYPFEARAHFDEPGYPKLHFIERKYAGDETNWWVPNRACAVAMLRSAGFSVTENPEEEVFLCRPGRGQ